jgi:acyl carrier protein
MPEEKFDAGKPGELRERVRKFVSENFLFREDIESLSDSDSFLEAGIIDSTGVLELISFIEGEFGIEVADAEMIPENFDSIERIVAYVQRKLCAGAGAPDLGRLATYAR